MAPLLRTCRIGLQSTGITGNNDAVKRYSWNSSVVHSPLKNVNLVSVEFSTKLEQFVIAYLNVTSLGALVVTLTCYGAL